MKALRSYLVLSLVLSSLCAAAPPRFYATAQIGRFEADGGSVFDAGLYPYRFRPDLGTTAGEDRIESGTKTCRDLALGAEFGRWFALEGGYAHFNAFASPLVTDFPPWIPTMVAIPAYRVIYQLQAYRLTAIVRVPIRSRFELKLLGGPGRVDGQIKTSAPISPGSLGDIGAGRHTDQLWHYGVGVVCNINRCLALEVRYLRDEFGRIRGKPALLTFQGNEIIRCPGTGMRLTTYSLGLTWRP